MKHSSAMPVSLVHRQDSGVGARLRSYLLFNAEVLGALIQHFQPDVDCRTAVNAVLGHYPLNKGTVKAVSPWRWLHTMPLLISCCRTA